MMPKPIAARVQRLRDVSRRFEVTPRQDLVELSKGEPDLDTPAVVVEAMKQALDEGRTHYGPVEGDSELRRVIADDANTRYGTAYSGADCLMTHGGAAAITATALALLQPGDRVVTADPSYSLYRDAVALAGAELIEATILPGEETAGLVELAELAIAEDAALIMICNPVNPSGATYTRADLEAFSETLEGSSIRVLVDEAYEAYIYEDGAFATALTIPGLRGRLLFCQTFSKTYAMTGWRLGYLMTADRAALTAIVDVHKTFNSCLNSAVQRAAIIAIETRDDTVPAMLEDYSARRQHVMTRLISIPGVRFVEPRGAFYVFFEYDFDIPSVEMRDLLVREYGIALRPGSEFGDGGERHLRLSYTYTRETLDEGINRIEVAFASLAARAPA